MSIKAHRFRKVLIANRGEIAVRIIHSLRQLGLRSVALASDADREALHARLADEVVDIGPAPAAESYLDMEKVLGAARDCSCCAIHPGYGFLSENADFAARCAEEGFVFIGPSAEAMLAMGDKSRARDIATSAGVPVVPGVSDVPPEGLGDAAAEVGFPLLLKPSAGGGGKGMVVINRMEELQEGAETARRVAMAAFGDDRLIVERFVHPARHIEIQIFADRHGEAVALGERECSLQRRHQKVVEECPSSVLKGEVRQAMEASALNLVREVGYAGAGTVEFLLGPDGAFYFLEMNTRLQVEHPVTEMVYGVDLVAAQIAVAQGETLPPSLRSARPRGHALEVRLYAEDPDAGFLPTPGEILGLNIPAIPDVRFDGALDGPGIVSAEYDPMIAKLVAWGHDRPAAIAKLLEALGETAILGIKTNTGFLKRLCAAPWFAAGDFHTATLDEMMQEDSLLTPPELPGEVLAAMALAFVQGSGPSAPAPGVGSEDGDVFSPFASQDAWRLLEEE